MAGKRTTAKQAKKQPKKSLGRPTGYAEAHDAQAYKLCLLGATDEEMADFFGVVVSTIYLWAKTHASFSEARARGKMAADAEVADRLFQRARGYSHPEVHITQFQGDVTMTDITKHYPPDTQAATWWLKNRQPAKWKDKSELDIAVDDVTDRLSAGRARAAATPKPEDS